MSEPDLSKIVGLIMENPKLIEEIKSLSSKADTAMEAKPAEEEKTALSSIEHEEEVAASAPQNTSRIRRRELLSALKPYVSEGRGKALDSVMSIVDIIEMMRSN